MMNRKTRIITGIAAIAFPLTMVPLAMPAAANPNHGISDTYVTQYLPVKKVPTGSSGKVFFVNAKNKKLSKKTNIGVVDCFADGCYTKNWDNRFLGKSGWKVLKITTPGGKQIVTKIKGQKEVTVAQPNQFGVVGDTQTVNIPFEIQRANGGLMNVQWRGVTYKQGELPLCVWDAQYVPRKGVTDGLESTNKWSSWANRTASSREIQVADVSSRPAPVGLCTSMWNAPSEEDFLNGVAPATYEQWVAQTEAAFYAYVAENGKAPYPTRATTAADQIGKTVFFSNLPTDRPYDFGVDYYYPGLNVYDPPECNPVASADGSSFCTYR